MIDTTKNSDIKLYKAVEELKSLVKNNVIVNDNMQTKLDRFINKTVVGTKQKMEEDLDFFFHDNVSQTKKKRKRIIKMYHLKS